MRIRTNLAILLLLLAPYFAVRGQKTAPLWRKSISRTILLDTGKERTTGNIFDAVKAGTLSDNIKAYNHYDYIFTQLTKDELHNIFWPIPDTITVEDPVAKKEITKILEHKLLTDSVYQYRFLENWKFDPTIYKTWVSCIAVAPVVNVYGDDETLRVRSPLFWLMYDALHNLISKNQQQWERITNLAWADHFQTDSTSPAVPPKHVLATRTISLYEDEDTVHHHLADETPDTFLSQILVGAIQNNKITAWDTANFLLQTKLPASKITEMITPKPDTTIIEDPVASQEIIKITLHDLNYGRINSYKILEDWSFDSTTGQVDVQVIAIAPLLYLLDDTGAYTGTKAMCWLRIEDVIGIIARYEEYHPTNTFAQQIWYSYFLSPYKSEVVRTFY